MGGSRRSRRKRCLAQLYLNVILKKRRLLRRKRKYWVHPILRKREENLEGDYHKLVPDMRVLRRSDFFTAFRMTPEAFDKLLAKVGPKIKKQTTKMRRPISPGERLAVTLRFMATGDSYFTIASSYRMSRSVVAKIIPETCAALWEVLQPEVMPAPNQQMWKQIANDFEYFW